MTRAAEPTPAPSFPVIQFPNEPLLVALIAAVAARFLHGLAHSYAQAISDLGMAVWAYVELTDGVNWFRRLLGAVFLVLTVMTVAKAMYA
jgi:hypothetical protein